MSHRLMRLKIIDENEMVQAPGFDPVKAKLLLRLSIAISSI